MIVYRKAPPTRYAPGKGRCSNCVHWDGMPQYRFVAWCRKVGNVRACDSRCAAHQARAERRGGGA